MYRRWREAHIADILSNPRDPVGQLALGRALLVVSCEIVLATIWPIYRSTDTLWCMAGALGLWLLVLALSGRLPWSRNWHRLPLVFPVSVLLGLTALGLNGDASAYGGLIVLCFVYIGLTQRPLTSFRLMPFALLAWFVLQHTWSAVLAVRLAIAVPTWLLIAELLAYRSVKVAQDHEALTDEAHTDALTGLPNRRQLDLRLAEAREGDTIVMCDLDRFKALNDEWGHAAGDQVLADFGQLLKESLRGQDAAGRYGGEEFVMILTGTSPEAGLDVLHRMRRAWSAKHPSVTFSTGISEVSAAAPVSAALRSADEALYASKAGGRNCDHILYHQVVRASV